MDRRLTANDPRLSRPHGQPPYRPVQHLQPANEYRDVRDVRSSRPWGQPTSYLGGQYGNYDRVHRAGSFDSSDGQPFDHRRPGQHDSHTPSFYNHHDITHEEMLRLSAECLVARDGFFTCASCALVGIPSKKFKRRTDLRRHVETTHLVHEQPRLDCAEQTCGRRGAKGFVRKDKHMEHMRDVHGWTAGR